MILWRHATERLQEWRTSDGRKPLILRGARQVGKTTLVRQFAQGFGSYLELNLDRPEHRDLFALGDVDRILSKAQLDAGRILTPGDSLVFIDEIQAEPKAIHLLRYFHELRPDLHVIAAGSLLEFALKDVPSMPVGRITYHYLHPLNFEEFLMAVGNPLALDALHTVPVPDHAHTSLRTLFHDYALIGGMPEPVAAYTQHRDPAQIPAIYASLWKTYQEDVEKYARNATERRVITHVMATAATALERVKFEGFGQSNYRSREVSEAFRALDKAGIFRLVRPTTSTEPPVLPDLRKRPRLQFLDTGLLNQVLGAHGSMVGIHDLAPVHRGRIVEHLVVQEIMSKNDLDDTPPCFWVREEASGNAEVDIVFRHGALLVPVEVKSGAQGTLRSLHQFVDRAPHPFAVRMYNGPVKVERHTTPGGTPYILLNMPYFLGTQLTAYIEWLVADHG